MNCVSDIACIEFPSRIPCRIDLKEPVIDVNGEQIETGLKLEAGMEYALNFTYKVGNPAADTFHVFFYATPQAVRDIMEKRVSPTAHQMSPDPAVAIEFIPSVPVADQTGVLEQNGVLQLGMPAMGAPKYYAILAMSHPQ